MTLCEDYRVGKEALGHWRVSDSEEAPARSSEYRALLQELEAEIMQNVNEFQKQVNYETTISVGLHACPVRFFRCSRTGG